jgi:pseudaminic acid biosynthesis-associated methylase
MKETKQMKVWKGKFGREYTERNFQTLKEMENLDKINFGHTRTQINHDFLPKMSKSSRILEVGCNIGNKLLCLRSMGFTNLYGIDIQSSAVKVARSRTGDITFLEGSAFDIPFKDGYFDMVFTAGVLIHISPKDIKKAMMEIVRCSRRYVWGFEYYADKVVDIHYRGHSNLLWKMDYKQTYIDAVKGLKLVKAKKYKYLNSPNVDEMYLLEKKGK